MLQPLSTSCNLPLHKQEQLIDFTYFKIYIISGYHVEETQCSLLNPEYNIRLSLDLFLEEIFSHGHKYLSCSFPKRCIQAPDQKLRVQKLGDQKLWFHCGPILFSKIKTYIWDPVYTFYTIWINKFSFPIDFPWGTFLLCNVL